VLVRAQGLLSHGTSVNVHEVVEDDDCINAIHTHAEVFEPSSEAAFKYLQVRV
jgi:sodium-dependent phosphate transporter